MTAKRAVIVTAAALLTAAVIAVFVWVGKTPVPEDGTAPPDAATPSQPYRIVGVWDGKVAVFLPLADTPETVYDTRVSTLPEEERQKLSAGIAAPDSDMLKRLLEDYLS